MRQYNPADGLFCRDGETFGMMWYREQPSWGAIITVCDHPRISTVGMRSTSTINRLNWHPRYRKYNFDLGLVLDMSTVTPSSGLSLKSFILWRQLLMAVRSEFSECRSNMEWKCWWSFSAIKKPSLSTQSFHWFKPWLWTLILRYPCGSQLVWYGQHTLDNSVKQHM